jgi:hypothetical protein
MNVGFVLLGGAAWRNILRNGLVRTHVFGGSTDTAVPGVAP